MEFVVVLIILIVAGMYGILFIAQHYPILLLIPVVLYGIISAAYKIGITIREKLQRGKK